MGTGAQRIGVVVNPAAGAGRAKEVGASLARRLADDGHRVAALSALSADVALENVRRELDRLDAVVIVGGDGMVHLAAQALAATAVPLGVVPVGTGNDFAQAAGLPLDDAGAMRWVLRCLREGGALRRVDLLRVEGDGIEGGGRWVAGALSAGLDAAVNARANRMRRPRGSSRYVLAAAAEILSYRSWGYRLVAEGVTINPQQLTQLVAFPGMTVGAPAEDGSVAVTWEQRGALVTAANGSTLGGGIRIAPNARIDDGSLELILARDVGRLTAARLFPLMLTGRHLGSTGLRALPARSVSIASTDPEEHSPAVFGDGERLGQLPLRVEVRPGALRLLG